MGDISLFVWRDIYGVAQKSDEYKLPVRTIICILILYKVMVELKYGSVHREI